jgi:hypothetical protein
VPDEDFLGDDAVHVSPDFDGWITAAQFIESAGGGRGCGVNFAMARISLPISAAALGSTRQHTGSTFARDTSGAYL